MLPIGPDRCPAAPNDIDFWYPRHVQYMEEMETLRIQSRKAMILALQLQNASLDDIHVVEHDLYNSRLHVQSKEIFADTWRKMSRSDRMIAMGKYMKGLQAVLAGHHGKTMAALEKYIRKPEKE